MQLHGNARTCPKRRRLLVERVLERGWSVAAAAEAAGVTERTVWRWLRRWREEGEAGLRDRSSRARPIGVALRQPVACPCGALLCSCDVSHLACVPSPVLVHEAAPAGGAVPPR